MAEARLCPKCGKMNLHRFTAQTIRNTGQTIETLHEETYWKCITQGCAHREEEEVIVKDPPS